VRRALDASSALARGELLQREDAWKPLDHARALPSSAATSRRRGCSRRRAGSARPRAAAGRTCSARFGRDIGLAFQLLDDVLDVSGPAERTGKHRGTDLLDGTVTLPLILACERDPDLARLDVRSVRSPDRAEAVCDAIAATGALEVARAEALTMVEAAKASLPVLPEAQQAALELVADGVVDRYS
jgi:geranylgeranyl pyrophosphate synthase